MIMHWLLMVCFLVPPLMTCAQDDSLHYTYGLPHMEEDSSVQRREKDLAPFDQRVSVSLEQLPPAIVNTLDNGHQYEGWENASISLDKNTKLYWVHFTTDSVTRSYGFHKNGTPVRIEEKEEGD